MIEQMKRLNRVEHTEKHWIRTQLRLLLANHVGKYLAREFNHETDSRPGWLRKLCAQMEEPSNLRGGVSTMQALAHTSSAHLSRTCRKELGCTPTQFVNKLRLTYAANLLLHSD